MSRWDEIPKIELDWSKDPLYILQESNDAYFKCALFCSAEILRGETWKLIAFTSLAFNFFFLYCMVLGK